MTRTPILVATALLALVPSDGRLAHANDCVPIPPEMCDELSTYCPTEYCAPDEEPRYHSTPDNGTVRPDFSHAPGSDTGADLARRIIPGLIPTVLGPLAAETTVPADAVRAQGEDNADTTEAAQLGDKLADAAKARQTPPRTRPRSPASNPVQVPQGGKDALLPDGRPNHTPSAEDDTDPVNPYNGEFYYDSIDLRLPSFGIEFVHQRFYRSRVSYDGPLGHGWTFRTTSGSFVSPSRSLPIRWSTSSVFAG